MKKIILSIFLLSGISAFSQRDDGFQQIRVLSLEASSSVGVNVGLTYEYTNNKKDDTKGAQSLIFKIHHVSSTLESDNIFVKDIDGTGFGIEAGVRTYFKENAYKGFYAGNYFSYGSISFEKDNLLTVGGTTEDNKFDGKYRYLSLLSPELGYKFLIAKKVAVNLHLGTSWLIEVKGKGDIDNKSFDNWVLRSGLSVGYSF